MTDRDYFLAAFLPHRTDHVVNVWGHLLLHVPKIAASKLNFFIAEFPLNSNCAEQVIHIRFQGADQTHVKEKRCLTYSSLLYMSHCSASVHVNTRAY